VAHCGGPAMTSRPYGLLVATLFSVLLLLFLSRVAEILLLLFIAILFAVYLSTITDWLQKRLGMPRWLGLLAALALTVVVVTGIGWLVVPPVITQTQQLIQSLPGLLENLNEQLRRLVERSPAAQLVLPRLLEGQSYMPGLVGEIGDYFRTAVPFVFGGLQFMIHLVSVLVMGIYLTARPGLYREGVISLVPVRWRELVRDILNDLGITLRAWTMGQIFAMFVLGLLTWVGLVLLRVPYALAFGVFTGLVAIVPFFGTLVSTLLPALFVLGSGGAGHALLVVLLGVVVHLVEANFVAPMIMERQVNLPPVLSILSVLVMAHLLHIIGLLVAVPVLATLIVIVRRVYVQRVLEGRGHRRAVRDRPLELRLPEGDAILVHPGAFDESLPSLLER
jgi:predicted PurR-regulated permease PerM